MSTAFLQHCANYFRTRTRRDPSADELRMLDRFAFLKQGDPARLSPVELYTNDPFVAETYADMMKKRGELRPDTKAPMSLVDALSLANDYLARAGKKPVYVTPHSLIEEVSFQAGALGSNTVVASSGIAQRSFLANPLPAQSNDLFWLLLPNAKKAQALPALMSDPSLGRIFKMLRKVEKDGVLSALLTMTNGAWIDLNRLARTQENPPLAPLTDAYAGAYLIRVPRENEKALQQLAASYAVYPLLFATATEGGEIAQKTEDLVGPYELHDFYLYYLIRYGFAPAKLYRLAKYALGSTYDDETLKKWLKVLLRRFFSQQFKRSCLPDGPAVGSVSISPRGAWLMPSDATAALWLAEADAL